MNPSDFFEKEPPRRILLREVDPEIALKKRNQKTEAGSRKAREGEDYEGVGKDAVGVGDNRNFAGGNSGNGAGARRRKARR
jgi:hypothetical protein